MHGVNRFLFLFFVFPPPPNCYWAQRIETIIINNTKANNRHKSATTEQYFSELLQFGKAIYPVKLCQFTNMYVNIMKPIQ